MSVKLGSDYPRLQVNELKAIARYHWGELDEFHRFVVYLSHLLMRTIKS